MNQTSAILRSAGYTVEQMENGRGIVVSKSGPPIKQREIKTLLTKQKIRWGALKFQPMIDTSAIGILEF